MQSKLNLKKCYHCLLYAEVICLLHQLTLPGLGVFENLRDGWRGTSSPVVYHPVSPENLCPIYMKLEPCVILAYSEPCHIQNPGMFKTRVSLSRYILPCSELCVTIVYWEPGHIQNFAIFQILAYLVRTGGIFRILFM